MNRMKNSKVLFPDSVFGHCPYCDKKLFFMKKDIIKYNLRTCKHCNKVFEVQIDVLNEV